MKKTRLKSCLLLLTISVVVTATIGCGGAPAAVKGGASGSVKNFNIDGCYGKAGNQGCAG